MVKEFEKVRRAESRTRSELVREALHEHFASRYPAVTPSKAELVAIRRGRAAFARGQFVSPGGLLEGLEPVSHRSGTKRPLKAAVKKPGRR
jgi:predicted transcriptional regulator